MLIAVQLLIIAVKKKIYGNSRSFTDIHVLKKMAVKRKKIFMSIPVHLW